MSELLTLITGLAMGESPRWHEDRLWFADWVTQMVVAVDLEGKSETILPAPSFPFCFDWLPDGRLLVVSGSKGILLCREPDGSLAPYADLASLATTPWKDIVVDGRGNAYIGNIGFHYPASEFTPGILALVKPNGGIKIAADDIAYPHGIVVTPDNSTLIVAEAYANRLTAFDIAENGSLSNCRVWADLEGGVPHGICLDNEGAVWYADILPFDVLCLILFLDRQGFLLWNGCLTDINDLNKTVPGIQEEASSINEPASVSHVPSRKSRFRSIQGVLSGSPSSLVNCCYLQKTGSESGFSLLNIV